MIKTIDDIMFMTDNNNPYRIGLLYGKGGLGYKPNPYNMVGGALEKIGQTEEEYNETMEKNKEILKKIGDEKLVKHYYDTLELRDIPAKDEVLNLINEEIDDRNIDIEEIETPKYNYEIGKSGKEEQDLFYYADVNAEKDNIRGDETEVILCDYIPEILTKTDNDESQIYNSKNVNSTYWNKDFIDVINKEDLTKFPIDAIKNNTIWEMKSYKEPLSKSIKLADTKIDGTNEYDIIFKNYMTNGGIKTKIENIYYLGKKGEYKNNPIPTLQHNNNGYDYYVAFNLKDKFGYYKPLEDENFYFRVDKTKDIKNKLIDNKIIDRKGNRIEKMENINDELKNDYKIWKLHKLSNEPIYVKEKNRNKNFISKGTMNYPKLKGYEEKRDKEYILNKKNISYFPKRYIKKFGDKYINKFIEENG